MVPYSYLEHTADIKIQATGNNIEECFKNFGIAVSNLIVEISSIKPKIEKKIKIKANSLEKLLYDFIEELLVLFDSEGYVTEKITSLNINNQILSATLVGDTVFNNNYETKLGVKAMTYNEMLIKNNNNNCVIEGVVDV